MFVRIFILAVIGVFMVLPGVNADELRALSTAEQGRDWRAVGRLNIGTTGFCSGALIDNDLVLTAAHCLYDKKTGDVADVGEIEFLAGWRNGRAEAYRNASKAVVHPLYKNESDIRTTQVRFDLALIQLDRPIRLPGVTPFRLGKTPRKWDEVGVVSYARERSETPSLQEVCNVLARIPGVLVFDCLVDFGASGAPVFDMNDGAPVIVSVVSAKSNARGEPIALGAMVEHTVDDLRERLLSREDVITPASPPVRRLGNSGASRDTSAKFLRP